MKKLWTLACLLALFLAAGCSTAVDEVGPAEAGNEDEAPPMEEMYPGMSEREKEAMERMNSEAAAADAEAEAAGKTPGNPGDEGEGGDGS